MNIIKEKLASAKKLFHEIDHCPCGCMDDQLDYYTTQIRLLEDLDKNLSPRLAKLERIAALLADLDWCPGYEILLTQIDTLDEARNLAREVIGSE